MFNLEESKKNMYRKIPKCDCNLHLREARRKHNGTKGVICMKRRVFIEI